MPGIESVAIVGMGPSIRTYVTAAIDAGGPEHLVDEVWAVNLAGAVIGHDKLFHMDDLHVQRARSEARPGTREGASVEWLVEHDRPIFTSKVHADFPMSVGYPIEGVVKATGSEYFNNTVPYAVAMAVMLGVKNIHLYGCDYAYPDGGSTRVEPGRACLEWWLGYCMARGITITLPPDTTLLDSLSNPGRKLYGYEGG